MPKHTFDVTTSKRSLGFAVKPFIFNSKKETKFVKNRKKYIDIEIEKPKIRQYDQEAL